MTSGSSDTPNPREHWYLHPARQLIDGVECYTWMFYPPEGHPEFDLWHHKVHHIPVAALWRES